MPTLIRSAATGVAVLVAVVVLGFPQAAYAPPPANSVTVINTPAQPVPITGGVSINETFPQEPFHATAEIPLPAGLLGGETVIVVPSGKRLVVEHVSINMNLLTGQAGFASVSVSNSGPIFRHFLFLTPTTCCSGAQQHHVGGQAMRLYADQFVFFAVRRTTNDGPGLAQVSVSGYLVAD
jgi:hypothetical protein